MCNCMDLPLLIQLFSWFVSFLMHSYSYSFNTWYERLDGGSLPHSGRQVGTHWYLPPPSHGHLESHWCRAPAWSSQVPHWDAGGVAEKSGPSPHLVCHHQGCDISGRRATWKGTQREVLLVKWTNCKCSLTLSLLVFGLLFSILTDVYLLFLSSNQLFITSQDHLCFIYTINSQKYTPFEQTPSPLFNPQFLMYIVGKLIFSLYKCPICSKHLLDLGMLSVSFKHIHSLICWLRRGFHCSQYVLRWAGLSPKEIMYVLTIIPLYFHVIIWLCDGTCSMSSHVGSQ